MPVSALGPLEVFLVFKVSSLSSYEAGELEWAAGGQLPLA